MLKLIAKSPRGRKQLKRHGDVWVPVEGNRQVSCLGGVPGIKLMSVRDRATFWMKVEGDANLIPVERLDNFGRPIRKAETVTAEQMAAAFDPLTQARENLAKHTDLQVMGATSGRSSASGEPNQSSLGDPAHVEPSPQTTAEVTT